MRYLKVAFTGLVLIIIPSFLLVSESSIKGMIENWMNDCIVVFEKESVRANRILVHGYLNGKPPKSLPITFASSSDSLINRIHFVNEVEQLGERASSFANLALHPQTSATCAGELCPEYGNTPSAPKFTIQLADLNTSFVYAFNVDFDMPAKPRDLDIFVQYARGDIEGGVCRVERANLFNWLFRMNRLEKFLAWIFIFVALSTVFGWFKGLSQGE